MKDRSSFYILFKKEKSKFMGGAIKLNKNLQKRRKIFYKNRAFYFEKKIFFFLFHCIPTENRSLSPSLIFWT